MTELRENRGFTLIELLVVVAIVGILAAVAIPQFAVYRQKGFDASAVTDLRNAATAEEGYYSSAGAYVTCDDATACAAILGFGYKKSRGVNLAMTAGSGMFTGTSSHINGSGKTWSYNSSAGGVTN